VICFQNMYLVYLYFLTKRKLRAELGFSSCENWEEGENLKNQTLYAFRHPLMLVEIFTRFLFWLLILWGNTVCAINLSLPSSIFFRYFVYFVKDFSFSPYVRSKVLALKSKKFYKLLFLKWLTLNFSNSTKLGWLF
jgi:hypothetical protein